MWLRKIEDYDRHGFSLSPVRGLVSIFSALIVLGITVVRDEADHGRKKESCEPIL